MRIFMLLSLFLSLSVTAATPALTPFSAHYTTSYKLGWFTLKIDAVRELKQLNNNNWQLTFDASTTGASLNEKSIVYLNDHQLTPVEYHYKTGGLLNKTPLNITFDKTTQTITDNNLKTTYSNLWEDNLQDNLSYMLQASIDLSQGKKELHYPIFKSDYVKTYSFAVSEQEPLKTAIGTLNTLRVERINDKKDRTISAWFAIDHSYQLVRLTESKKGKTTYEINITKLED